ncbi:TFIIB-type zinc ribbon-containing protein [Demequina capsici]|uniref:TFIIB-type zinc ribbon-containing protein n=1 Tax=Demequina capsici TaxID=3075620 RepID=A0AA96J7L6_9MICO|nr:TFIIB-type zinc ribbon-containing protein [Demequina sp. OYTSA14]WNM25317.1 TFIIB-type zinc ribbon-containing protein [Demequina sp. OYTSA14]
MAEEISTPAGSGDGVNRCPKCGASDVIELPEKQQFMCEFCRHTWGFTRLDEAMGLSQGIADLQGTTYSSAASDIASDEALVTLKCDGCGSEVVIDTDRSLQARCHWCKHVLSLNNRIPNGAVPDGILPFSVTREQAMGHISAFVQERRSFALPEFASTFRPENVMGVYLPYMTVDGNVSARLDGVGEILRRRIVREKQATRYQFDRYGVTRFLDIEIDDLIVESNFEKADITSATSTNNVINAILPFDVKNIVRFDAHFLGDNYTSQRRDMDIAEAETIAAGHFLTVARGDAAPTVRQYDRGVRWEAEQVRIDGARWTAVLLPVWLYGFVENRKGRMVTHYIAVNGRTGATMGSVPINTRKAAMLAWGVAIGVSLITWPLAFAMLAAS